MNAIFVLLGGGVGALCRYALSSLAVGRLGGGFAWGTAVVNLAGCFMIGTAAGLVERSAMPRPLWLLLVTGFLGGFTTFSTFSLETVTMLRSGETARAALNAGVNVLGGFAATVAGLLLVVRGA